MKNNFILILCCFMFVLFSSFLNSFFGNKISEKRKIATELTRSLSKNFEKNYELNYMGISEEAQDGKYKCIGFELNSKKILSKEEGRILLIKCADDILAALNSNQKLKPYMSDYPFTGNNIIINIYIQPPNVSNVYFPDISIFSYFMNNLEYEYKKVRGNHKEYTSEFESLEESIRIVQSQQDDWFQKKQ